MAAAAANTAVALGSSFTQKNAAKSLRAPRPVSKVAPVRSVAVRAQAEDASASRRSVLSLIAATIAAASTPAAFANDAPKTIELIPAPKNALKDRDEAFDVDLDYRQRFSFSQLSRDDTVIRLKDAVASLKSIPDSIKTKTWWEVQSTLRTKSSYLRFDFEKLIATQSKEVRKDLLAELDALYKTIEKLDYTVTRVLDTDKALALYAQLEKDVNSLVAKVV